MNETPFPSADPLAVLPASQQFENNLELLAEMGREFATSMDLDDALLKAVGYITESVDAEGGALFMLDDTGELLRCHACVGATEITGLVLEAGKGIVGRCVQSDVGEVVRDVSKDPNFFGGVDEKTGYQTRSILCSPMSVKGTKVGAIELINKRGGDGRFSQADLTLLNALAASAALAIINARQAESLVEQERLRRELELAREIQRSLLPMPESDTAPVYGVNRPAREVSGDFFDFFTLDDGRICFNLGDVSGKGMNAALLMAKTASLYRCLGKSVLSPGRLLGHINREICETAHRGMFVTMVGGVFDPRTNTIRLANAGHEPPLRMAPDGSFEEFEADGPPLGILPDPPTPKGYPEIEIQLEEGGSFWIFTDGVTEGYTGTGDELGVDGVQKTLRATQGATLKERIEAVVDLVQPGEKGLRDDITILGLSPTKEGGPNTSAVLPQAAEMDVVLDISVPARADRLKLVRASVRSGAEFCGLQGDDVADVVLAVDEACQNIIRHGYSGREDGEMGIQIRREGDQMVIDLKDFAAPVDEANVQPRDLQDIRPGGLGTHLIREIMDGVEFLPPPPGIGNLLCLKKKLS